jgi:hypothetical protein
MDMVMVVTNKRERNQAREYQTAHPGTSYTKALHTVRAQEPSAPFIPEPAVPEPAVAEPAVDLAQYLGVYVQLSAPRRRTLRGVVLPPAPRSRSGRLRLAVDGGRGVRPFDTEGYTVTRIAGPTYGYGTLPAEHLATKTMLETGQRRQPAPGQQPLGQYEVTARRRQGLYPLYAVVDTASMAPLPPAQAAQWTRVRTCQQCGKGFPRPLPAGPADERFCDACHAAARLTRFAAQVRPLQSQVGAWAREVLQNPQTMLAESDRWPDPPRLRVETLDGTLVADVRLRRERSPEDMNWWSGTSQESKDRFWERMEGTTWFGDFTETAQLIADGSVIMWDERDYVPVLREFHDLPHPTLPAGNQLADRVSLWRAGASSGGYWYREPAFHQSSRWPAKEQAELDAVDRSDLAGKIQVMRQILERLAFEELPEPTPAP